MTDNKALARALRRQGRNRAMSGLDPTAEQAAALTDRPGVERDGPDWEALQAMGAAAADPFNIPSAAVGMFSAALRDKWRGVQRQAGPVPALIGSLGSGMGATTALVLALRSAPVAAQAGGLGGAAAGSDFVDAAAGKDDAISGNTAVKAFLGAAPALPTKALLGGGAVAGGAAMAAGPAEAQDGDGFGSAAERQRYQALQQKLTKGGTLSRAEREEFNRLGEGPAAANRARIAAEADRRRGEDEATRKANELRVMNDEAERKALAEELRGKQKVAGERAQGAYDKTMADRTMADTPWKDTWLGSRVNSMMLPLVIGGATGLLLGGKSAVGQRVATRRWNSALDDVEKAATPSQSLRAQIDARTYGDKVFPQQAPSAAAAYAGPAAAGAVEGAAGTYLPTLWDRALNEDNAERKALARALDELPADHPDRARWQSRHDAAEPETPARTAARNTDLADKTGEAVARAAVGAAAGVAGKTLASTVAPSAARISELRAKSQKATLDPAHVSAEGRRMADVGQADQAYLGVVAERERNAAALAEALRRSGGQTGAQQSAAPVAPHPAGPTLPAQPQPSAAQSGGTSLVPVAPSSEIVARGAPYAQDLREANDRLSTIVDLLRQRPAVSTPPQRMAQQAEQFPLPDGVTSALTANRAYGQNHSGRLQQYTVDAAERGVDIASKGRTGFNRAQASRDLGMPQTMVKNATENALTILRDRGLPPTPANLRALADELNQAPGIRERAGNVYWSLPAALGGGAAATDDEQRRALAAALRGGM